MINSSEKKIICSIRKLIALSVLATGVFILSNCKEEVSTSAGSQHLIFSKDQVSNYWDGTMIFNTPDNPFLKPIKSNYTIHSKSDSMLSLLKNSCGPNNNNTYVVATNYSSPVYIATDSTPKKDIKITLYNIPQGKSHIINVPIVPGSEAAIGSDKHYIVIDKDSRCAKEFWIFNQNKAASGNGISIDSNGIYRNGKSSVAAGFSQLQGIIWPKELREKKIEHALFFSCSVTNSNGYVYPATSNDGAIANNPYAIPQGTLVRIRPNVNIDTISGITDVEKTIYSALQKYGMYCGDTNGAGLGIKAVSVQSINKDAYPSNFDLNNNFGSYYLKKFPFSLMEVVYTGPLTKSIQRPILTNQCISWR